MPNNVTGGGSLQSGPAAISGTADFRFNLAVPHLISAGIQCRKVHDLENTHDGEVFGEFWNEIFANASGTLFTAVASLEAYVNELFIDYDKNFPEMEHAVMNHIWETYERKSILEKYEFALVIKKADVFNRGENPYQDVSAIIQLRNGLMHFKPEWFSTQEEHAKLSRRLASLVTASPFLPSTEPLFPRGWASHQTLVWVIHSILNFLMEFEGRAKIEPKLAKHKDKFSDL